MRQSPSNNSPSGFGMDSPLSPSNRRQYSSRQDSTISVIDDTETYSPDHLQQQQQQASESSDGQSSVVAKATTRIKLKSRRPLQGPNASGKNKAESDTDNDFEIVGTMEKELSVGVITRDSGYQPTLMQRAGASDVSVVDFSTNTRAYFDQESNQGSLAGQVSGKSVRRIGRGKVISGPSSRHLLAAANSKSQLDQRKGNSVSDADAYSGFQDNSQINNEPEYSSSWTKALDYR